MEQPEWRVLHHPLLPSRFSPLRRGSRVLEVKMFIKDCIIRTWGGGRERGKALVCGTGDVQALEDNWEMKKRQGAGMGTHFARDQQLCLATLAGQEMLGREQQGIWLRILSQPCRLREGVAARSVWGSECTLRSHVGRQGGMSPPPVPQKAPSSVLRALVMVQDSLPRKCQQQNPSERA